MIADTYYDPVLNGWFGKSQPLDKMHEHIEHSSKIAYTTLFGTANFYSDALNYYDCDNIAYDVIMNIPGYNRNNLISYYLRNAPDILYCQNLSFFTEEEIKLFKNAGTLVVGQISCPWPGDEIIKRYDLLFTSFPHYVHRIRALGVKCELLQIGFGGRSILERINYSGTRNNWAFRDNDISFVGGVGYDQQGGHWSAGTDFLNAIAKEFKNKFKWYGYGYQLLDKEKHKALIETYQGEAWGLHMYEIYSNTKIVVNRHGEVAQGYANNMRMFEATGVGALLLTEEAPNLSTYFNDKECITYNNIDEAIHKISLHLYDNSSKDIAEAGFFKTNSRHTYRKILKFAYDKIMELKCKK